MEKTLGEITGGGVRVDRDEPWLVGVDVGRPIVEDFRDWPLEVERDEARRHDRNTSRLMNSLRLPRLHRDDRRHLPEEAVTQPAPTTA